MGKHFPEIKYKGMIVMASAVCRDVYCDSTIKKINSSNMNVADKLLIVGGYAVVMLVFGVLMFYGVSAGYYPDLSILQ